MLREIEAGVIARLKVAGLGVKKIGSADDVTGMNTPEIAVAINTGTFAPLTIEKRRLNVTISVYVLFKCLGKLDERQRGIYPIVEGVVGYLMGQTLGLSINPIAPRSFRDATPPEYREIGQTVYQVDLETAYPVSAIDDSEAVELVTLGLNYYIKPGDDVADAQDIVEI
jgi:hypothetical protein